MPYPPLQPRRVPTTRETHATEFARSDGSHDPQGTFAKATGATPEADIDAQIVYRKTELACGCYWPDVDVAGVCAECVEERKRPDVCTAHYIVCRCGAPCCWQHSRPIEDGSERICTRCHRREKNTEAIANAISATGSVALRIFFKQPR